MKDYYKILGIKSDATPEQITAAYERLLDFLESYGAYYSDQIKQDIDIAFDTLSNPAERNKYDRQLHKHLAVKGEFLHSPPAARKSESVELVGDCGRKFLGCIISSIAISLILAIMGLAVQHNSARQNPTPVRQIRTATTLPAEFEQTLTPFDGQRCMARSKENRPLQLLADGADNAVVLNTIDPETTFSGIWHQKWFEFDDSIPGLPQHGYVRQADIVAVNCY